MNKKAQFLLVLFLLTSVAHASTNKSISANVTVTCPFNLEMHTLPIYPRTGNIIVNYTIFTQASCTSQNVNGNFTLTNQSGNVVIFAHQQISSISNANTMENIAINTLTLSTGNYMATVAFATLGTQNSSSSKFQLLNPANISLTSFSTAQQVDINAPINFYASISNFGFYASGPIVFHILINGPVDYNITYNALALAAYPSSENLTVSLSNVTGTAGQYSAEAYATYMVGNTPEISNNRTASYLVSAPSSSSSSSIPIPTHPITVIPELSLTSVPMYTFAPVGSKTLGLLGMQNIAKSQETVNISVPSSFSNLLLPSKTTFLINPNATAVEQLLFNATKVSPGTYIIPLNISVRVGSGAPQSQDEYLTFTVFNRSKTSPSISDQISLINYSKEAQGVVTIYAPSNISINNATLITTIPLAVAQNISQITAYGIPNNISVQNGVYTITWLISSLPANQTIYAYFTILSPSSQNFIQRIQNALVTPSVTPPSSIMRIADIKLPTFYTDSLNTIEVLTLFTGSRQQQVVTTLSAPPGVTVYNATQIVNATPNQLLDQKFVVSTNANTGTLLFTLTIATSGYNSTTSLPVLVIQKTTTSAPTTISQTSFTLTNQDKIIVLLIIALTAGTILALVAYRRGSKPKFDPERAERLIRMREQIERGAEEHKHE